MAVGECVQSKRNGIYKWGAGQKGVGHNGRASLDLSVGRFGCR